MLRSAQGWSRTPKINEKIEPVTVPKLRLPRLLPTLAAACSLVLLTQATHAFAAKAAEQAGANLFRDKGCAYCHGATAQGTQKGPSLANIRKTMKPAQISAQIENGGQKMPSFSDSLSKDEVAQLVAWLRAKHRPAPAPVPAPAQTSAPVSNPGQ
jgi:mono/diheme cytochrome c family protein